MDVSVDRWLGVFGAATGALGIILAYVFYRKSIRTKVLSIAYTDPVPLIMTLADISVTYLTQNITALSRVYVLLWNRGTAPIEASDFIAPIEFKSTDAVLKLEIHDKDAAVSAHLDPQTGVMTIDLLRPGEAIMIITEVANETFRPDLQVQMKSPEMSAMISGYQAIYPGITAFLGGMLFLAGEIAFIAIIAPKTPPDVLKDIPDNTQIAAFIGALLCVFIVFPALFGALLNWIASRLMFRSTTPVAERFFKLKLAAVATRQKARAFRKYIDIANKK
jgi:hypothetical protein